MKLLYPNDTLLQKQHFPGNPVVPAALIIGDFLALNNIDSANWSFKFNKPLRPGTACKWERVDDHFMLTSVDGCFAHAYRRPSTIPGADYKHSGAMTECSTKLSRPSLFTFYARYHRDESSAQVILDDVDALVSSLYPHCGGSALFFTYLECAGNLALELSESQVDYQFYQFDNIYLSPCQPKSINISSVLINSGAVLIWKCSATNEKKDLVFSCTRSVSVPL